MKRLCNWAAVTPWTFWYVSPSYGLGKKTIWDDNEMLPSVLPYWNENNPIYKKNESDLRVRFNKYGGSIYVLGADRPDLMRGPNPYGIIIDEASVQKKDLWENVLQPIAMANPKAWVWFTGTPRGKNHFYDLKIQHKDDPDWQFITQNVYDTKIFTAEQIDSIRRQMSDASFRQEFLCEFLEGEGSVFRNVRNVLYKPTTEELDVRGGHRYVMGVDLAKHQDYTVIVVYDRETNKQVYQDRFNQLEWPYIKAKIRATSIRFNNALVVVDATGLGDPIADDLLRAGVILEPFKLTNTSKKDIIEKLSIAIEQRYIRILPEEATLLEFDNYEYEYTKSGLVTYNARSGMHDDIVIAHALAVSQLTPVHKTVIPEELTPLQAYFKELTQPNHDSNTEAWNQWFSEGSYDE